LFFEREWLSVVQVQQNSHSTGAKKKQQFAVLLFKSKKGRGKIFLRMSVCWNLFLAFVF
jgi:hypothetical protein